MQVLRKHNKFLLQYYKTCQKDMLADLQEPHKLILFQIASCRRAGMYTQVLELRAQGHYFHKQAHCLELQEMQCKHIGPQEKLQIRLLEKKDWKLLQLRRAAR